MSGRVNPFADLGELPAFRVKPKKDTPVASAAIDRLAEDNNFPSRQAKRVAKEPKHKPRLHRTGRDQQFSVKTTPETKARFYRMADERKTTLGQLFERALDALERAGDPNESTLRVS